MNASWLDGIGVALTVAGALLWLGLCLRRNMKRPPADGNKSAACTGACADCPFARGCKRP